MTTQESENVLRARAMLAARERNPERLIELGKTLKRENEIPLARRLLARAWAEDPSKPELHHHLAVCTYKDPELPVAERLGWAEKVLDQGEYKDTSDKDRQETFGIRGAIHKRRWEVDTQRQHLERALACYEAGFALDKSTDKWWYTGINAAFVSDLLADLEEQSGGNAAGAADHRDRARKIREDIVQVLTKELEQVGTPAEGHWWPLATLVEAHFGLRDYAKAREWMAKAAKVPDVSEWERESTARQLGTLARLQEPGIETAREFKASEVGRTLDVLFGGRAGALSTAFHGKVGVALSGGGYRASLFHLGVLARLAEHDVLRHVEVLSCVSGGSIVGAHYYLKVRKLLQEKPDGGVEPGDYVELVDELIDEFMAGVQRNIRTRVAAELTTNLKMAFRPGYTRTLRAGELFERHIFASAKDGARSAGLPLREIGTQPAGGPARFDPRVHNWSREAKVPVLVLNATSLNTGHNWQFTASRMGESPDAIDPEIDTNYRLRRLQYATQAPPRHRDLSLGQAVAASAAVPGLFDPLVLPKLYKGKTIRLVDGGVHDNQGNVSLLEQGCTEILVSDAGGQMDARDDPKAGLFPVLTRSNAILMSRVRQAQYHDLVARRRSGLLRDLVYVHLKKGLDAETVDWVDSQDPYDESDDPRPKRSREEAVLTPYGIHKEIQRSLAAIRTDLDSFCDAEAYALMTSGYRMVEEELDQGGHSFPAKPVVEHGWRFLEIAPAMTVSTDPAVQDARTRLHRLLRVANRRMFKAWLLIPWLRVTGVVLGAAALGGLGWAFWHWRATPALTWGRVGLLLLGLLAALVTNKTISRILELRNAPSRVLIGLGMSLGGWLGARLHLHVFDRLYLRRGRVERILRG